MSDADERHERPGGRWLPVAVLRPFAPAHLPDVECISRMAELMRQVRVERRGRWPITSARNSNPGPPCRTSLGRRLPSHSLQAAYRRTATRAAPASACGEKGEGGEGEKVDNHVNGGPYVQRSSVGD